MSENEKPLEVGDICETTTYRWRVVVLALHPTEQTADCFILAAPGEELNLLRPDEKAVGTQGCWCTCDLIPTGQIRDDVEALQEFVVNQHVSDCRCELCKIVTERWNRRNPD